MKRNLFTLAIAAAFAAPLAFAAGDRASSGSSAAQSSAQGASQGRQALSAAETFNRLDTNDDGYISKVEAGLIPDVIVIFPVADTDKDDKLSRAELDEGLAQRGRGGMTEGTRKPGGPLGGDPLGADPAGRAGSGAR